MTNEIGAFFAGTTTDAPEASRAVAAHLKRYWEPRMRSQMIAYYEERNGAGLTELAKNAVALMAAESKAKPAASAAVPGAKA